MSSVNRGADSLCRLPGDPICGRLQARRNADSKTVCATVVLMLTVALAMGQDARQIIDKTQQGSKSKSEHYEGTLEVQDPTGKVSTKRWIFDRLGSAGDSKSVLRFTAPAEIKGVALLIVNHPDHSSDQWIWTPA